MSVHWLLAHVLDAAHARNSGGQVVAGRLAAGQRQFHAKVEFGCGRSVIRTEVPLIEVRGVALFVVPSVLLLAVSVAIAD